MPTVESQKASPTAGPAKAEDSEKFGEAAAALGALARVAATDCRDPLGERKTVDAVANPFGVPNHLRRLSDKILAAFNHAYAAGEEEIARRLHTALVAAERQASSQNPERRVGTALLQAELWVGYIEARNRYLGLAQDSAADPRLLATAEREMRAAHRQWSEM
jgi:hypothetical protein